MNTTKCPEGMHQVMSCLSPAEHQAIKDAGIAREKFGRQGVQRVIATECTRFGIGYLNRETGELPTPIETRPSSVFPTTTFANHEDLRSTMDAYPYPCWAALPNNACIHVNPLVVQFTGQPVEEFLKDLWLGKVHPGDQKRVCRISRAGFQNLRPFENFYRMCKADGSWGWFEDRIYPFYRPSGHLAGYVGLMRFIGYDLDPESSHESILSL